MGRRLPLLRGLAILAVVCNHAAGWGYTAMFWWAHQYRPVVSPNFDQLGSPTYYGLVLVQQLTLFSVPAFLFISGFFMTYVARGQTQNLSWRVVRTRISNLLWPYLIWSVAIFIGNGLQGKVFSPVEYICQLLMGGATGAYFFVPLVCQFYLLSPWIVRLGKDHPIVLLALAAGIQLLINGLSYLQLDGVHLPGTVFRSGWLFVRSAFYFSLGVVVSFQSRPIHTLVTRLRWVLAAATVILAILSVLEAYWLYQATTQEFGAQLFDWAHSRTKLSSSLYAAVFILTFLSFDARKGRLSLALRWIGQRSYGIYLLHPELLTLMARGIHHVFPQLLSRQLILMSILAIVGIGIPLLVMEGIARSPARRVYRYLFG